MNVKTQKRSRLALHIALLAVMGLAVIAPVLLPGSANVAIAFPEYRHSYNNTPQGFGWTVEGSSGATNPEGVLGTEVDGCAATNHTNVVNGYVTYDLGEVFLIDEVYLYADAGQITLFTSIDGSTWGEQAQRLYTSCNYGPGTDHWSVGVPGNGESVRYIKFSVSGESNWDWFVIHALSQATPTPTPLPSASPFPAQPTACVTVTPTPPATAQRTPTPFRLTPGATSTPVGTATPTPQPSFDSGVAKFDQSLSPWTVADPNYLGVFVTEWQSTAGADGLPGLAYMRDYIGWLEPTPSVLTSTAPITGALTYSRPQGFSFPLRITGQAKWAETTLQGEKPYIRIWYFDPDYEGIGHGAWVMAPPDWIALDGSAWRSFAYTLSQHGGSGRMTAIAITEEIVDVVEVDHLGVQLDNLRIYSGPLAVASSYPICPGTGGSGKPPVAIKQCKVNALVTNVYAGCTAPTDALDLAGWISYYFCRLWHYLWFVNENRAQITDILDRQNSNEPIGTLGEMDDVLSELYGIVASVGAVYSGNDYYTVDWNTLFAGWDSFDFSNITANWQTTPDPINEQEIMSVCPSTFANAQNSDIRKSACWVSWVLKVKLRWWVLLQYALDASAIIFAIHVIMEWLGQHG